MNLTIALEMPEDILLSLPKDPHDVADAIRMAAAVKMYELGRLSSGAAAEMAGIPKPVFMSRLAEYGVNTFDMTADELAEDLLA